jgi:hypothetical protein
MHAAAAHRNVWGRRAVVGVVAAIAVAAITWCTYDAQSETEVPTTDYGTFTSLGWKF